MGKLYRLKAAADPGALDIYIYGDVEGDYRSARTNEIVESKTSAKFFKNEFKKYPEVKKINLYVNSWGGAVQEGFEIRKLLKNHPAKVIGCVDGFAGSVASYILTGCDNIIMNHNTMQQLDNFREFCIGNATQLREVASTLDKYNEIARDGYLEKSNDKITKGKLKDLMDKSTWLTAADCIEYGLADEIDTDKTSTSNLPGILQQRFVTRNLSGLTQPVKQAKTNHNNIEVLITDAMKKYK
jgi:ATP-dependent protease ClpP protease subunit